MVLALFEVRLLSLMGEEDMKFPRRGEVRTPIVSPPVVSLLSLPAARDLLFRFS